MVAPRCSFSNAMSSRIIQHKYPAADSWSIAIQTTSEQTLVSPNLETRHTPCTQRHPIYVHHTPVRPRTIHQRRRSPTPPLCCRSCSRRPILNRRRIPRPSRPLTRTPSIIHNHHHPHANISIPAHQRRAVNPLVPAFLVQSGDPSYFGCHAAPFRECGGEFIPHAVRAADFGHEGRL